MRERQASTFRKGQFTDSHVKVLAYLNQLGVSYKAEEVVRCKDIFDGNGREVFYKVDVVITDPRYRYGIIEIEGKGSNTSNRPKGDYNLLTWTAISWIEHLPNKEVSLLAVSQILARHRL